MCFSGYLAVFLKILLRVCAFKCDCSVPVGTQLVKRPYRSCLIHEHRFLISVV